MRVIFLGPPGSGKGTQAKLLSSQYHIPHISTGDIFRDQVNRKTTIGQQLKKNLAAGMLVSDELTCEIVFKRLEAPDCAGGFILDGFPRTLKQSRDLKDFLEAKNLRLDSVFYFDIEEAMLINRLSQRRQCNGCNRVYNLASDPPQREGICDRCAGALVTRSDDEPNTIHRRLKIYQDLTAPLVEFYENQKLLSRVNAVKSVNLVTQDLMESLTKFVTR